MNRKITIGGNISVTLNVTKLDKMKEEMAKKYVTRVGVLGQKTNRTDKSKSGQLTNAEIGLKQEMGVYSERIPRRSFLEMPLTMKMPKYAAQFGDWLIQAIEEGNLKPAYVNLGIKGEQIVQEAFASRGFGIWPDNAPLTIALKGSDSPLIDTGELRRAITSDVVQK